MHLTGHKKVSMVKRYTHLAPDFQERAIAALNAYELSLGTVNKNTPAQNLPKSLVDMVGATGIEPVTPAV